MKVKTYCVGMIENNDYLVWDEETNEAFLVDASSRCQTIIDDVNNLNLNLKYIILTHGHFDHTDGLDFYRNAFPDAKLVAGKKEAKMLFNRDLSMGKGGITADIWVKDEDALKCGNIEVKILETPGHSSGSICILADKTLFSGDTLFQASVGRTDFPTGSMSELLDSIHNKLFVLPDDTRVLPGHNDETTIGFEKRYNPFV